VLVAAVLVALGATFVGACSRSSRAGATNPPDPVVATVSGRPIHESRVSALLGESRLIDRAITRKQALKGIVDEELLRQEAERLGVTLPQALVDARLRDLERRVGGAAALDKVLKSVRLTRAQLRERLAVVVLGDRLAAAKSPTMSVTRPEAEAYYRRHLFVFTAPAAVKLGEIVVRNVQMARGAIRAIRGGTSFYETAKTFNRDPLLRRIGGQLGWVRTDTLPGPIAKAIAKLRPGQISGPVRTVSGCSVLRLYGRRAARTIPFAEVERQVTASALSQRRAAALRRWLDRARDKAQVKILP
jgi:parvulin-like peptidyl-prolyl isomerase